MRIRELDGLRGIAVLAVMMLHYLSRLPQTGTQNMWLGVDLFLILSGFLIISILLNLRDKERLFSVFNKRRAMGIFPPYFLGIATYLTITVITHKTGSVNLWTQCIFYCASLFPGHPKGSDDAVVLFVLARHSAAIWQTVISFVVSLSVAYALWYGKESRILNWKDSHVSSPAHP